jgi:hypothetical protein
LSVAATSIGPSELSTMAQRIVTPAPPLTHADGAMPSPPLHRIVEPRGALEPRIVDRSGDAFAFGQRLARPLLAQRAGIGGGREPGQPREHALEVARRIARGAGQLGQRQRRLGRLDRLDRAQHRLLVAGDVVGQAAQARPQAGLARLLASREEADVGAAGMACGAGRTAVDAGGEHAGDEAPVVSAIAAQHRGPGPRRRR